LRDITVLVTAAGNVFMPGTTACLKNNGERNIRLIGADMNDDPSILKMCDIYYLVPKGDSSDYIHRLLEICKKEKVDVLLPVMSVELEALAANKDKFKAIGTEVSVSDIEPLRIANDKMRLFDFMKSAGIRCAEYCSVRTMEQLKEAVRELGYPEKRVCVKATNGSGSRGFRIIGSSVSRFEMFMHEKPSSSLISLEEFESILSEAETFPELMVMEYLPGDEYTVDILSDKGKVLYNCCRRSLRMENSIMLDCVIEDDHGVQKLCSQVTESLGLDGNIGFDIRCREDGTPIIMECNPRITAGIPVFALAGVNLPYLCVKKLLGEPLPEYKAEQGKCIHRRWMEM